MVRSLSATGLIFGLIITTGCGERSTIQPKPLSEKAMTLEERFPGSWSEDMHPGITRSLIGSHIRDCGQYKWKAGKEGSGEFLVHCTADGTHWRAYLVRPSLEMAQGPYSIDGPIPN